MKINYSPEFLEKITTELRYLQEKENEIKNEIKDKFAEAKSKGLDVKILKKLISIKDIEKFQIELHLMEVYAKVVQPDLFK